MEERKKLIGILVTVTVVYAIISIRRDRLSLFENTAVTPTRANSETDIGTATFGVSN